MSGKTVSSRKILLPTPPLSGDVLISGDRSGHLIGFGYLPPPSLVMSVRTVHAKTKPDPAALRTVSSTGSGRRTGTVSEGVLDWRHSIPSSHVVAGQVSHKFSCQPLIVRRTGMVTGKSTVMTD
jgi:hypothetical protein